nr:MAG TPA: hypothetical protein [Caudoviricetes sp.]
MKYYIMLRRSFQGTRRSVFIMAKIELLDSYEELVSYTAEIRESLDILHEWLAKKPNIEDYWSYHNLIAGHGQHFALLNLIMYRLDSLKDEHRTIIDNYIKGV